MRQYGHKGTENTCSTAMYYDPDIYPDDTLKAFNEYIQMYELRYDAQYPDPPKVLLDAAIERWKLTAGAKDMKIDHEQHNAIRKNGVPKTKSRKCLGCFRRKGCMKIGKSQNQTSTNERRQVGQILFPKCRCTTGRKKTSP